MIVKILVLFLLAWQEAPLSRRDLKVELSIKESKGMSVGGVATLTIKYKNLTDAKLRINDPRVSAHVHCSGKCESSEARRFGRSFGAGKVFEIKNPDGSTTELRERAPETPLTMQPGAELVYDVSVDYTWSHILRPGEWTIDHVDYSNKVQGNTARFTVVYRRETVDIILSKFNDPKLSDSFKRDWSEWLTELKPDAKFPFPRQDSPPKERAERTLRTQSAIREFEAWWKKSRDSAEVRDRIADINEKYNVFDPDPDGQAASSKKPAEKDAAPPAKKK